MSPIYTIEDCCGKYDLVEIFEPVRGTGGTLAYNIIVDGVTIIFEMNDEGVWEADNATQELNECIDSVIKEIEAKH